MKWGKTMKKIGICACYDNYNYGSMLQAFATQKMITQLGYENEFIVYIHLKIFHNTYFQMNI